MRVSASRELGRPLECAWAKTAAAGSRSSSASAGWASASAANRPARASRKGLTSGRYSYSVGLPGAWCSSNENGTSPPSPSSRLTAANPPRQNARSVWCRLGDRITRPLTRPVAPLLSPTAGTPGTSRPSGSHRPGRERRSASDTAGMDALPCDRSHAPRGRCRRSAASGAPLARARPEAPPPTFLRRGATGRPRLARAPPPSTCSRSRRRDAGREGHRRPRGRPLDGGSRPSESRSGGRARMSGPRLRTARLFNSSTEPFHSTASRPRPRSTSQGRPRVAEPRARTVQRPDIRRWLRSTSPPSKLSSRFLPTASTPSRRRPSSCSATPVAAARGFGLSTSTVSPTSTWSRRAAR